MSREGDERSNQVVDTQERVKAQIENTFGDIIQMFTCERDRLLGQVDHIAKGDLDILQHIQHEQNQVQSEVISLSEEAYGVIKVV